MIHINLEIYRPYPRPERTIVAVVVYGWVDNPRYFRKLCLTVGAMIVESRSSDIFRQLRVLDSRKFVDHAGKWI